MLIMHGGVETNFVLQADRKSLLDRAREIANKYHVKEDRVYDVLYSEYVFKHYALSKDELRIKTNICEECRYWASIEVFGSGITFNVPAAFVSVLKKASNIDVCSKTDKTIWLGLMFYDLVAPDDGQ